MRSPVVRLSRIARAPRAPLSTAAHILPQDLLLRSESARLPTNPDRPVSAVLEEARTQRGSQLTYKELKKQLRYGDTLLEPSAVRPKDAEPLEDTGRKNIDLNALEYLREVKLVIQEIIELLDVITSPGSATRSSSKTVYPTHFTRRYRSATRVPQLPEHLTVESVDEYLADITQYYYVHKSERVSDAVGAVSQILQDIFRPGNPRTRGLLSLSAYKRAIRFFLGAEDVESARWILSVMPDQFLQPDRETFHYFLWGLGKQLKRDPYPSDRGNPVRAVLALVGNMSEASVSADNETWNLVLQAMPMGFGKSFVMEEMEKRDIELNQRSQCVCIDLICDKIGVEPAVRYAMELSKRQPMTASVMATLVAAMLRAKPRSKGKTHGKGGSTSNSNQNVVQAFQFVDYAIRNLGLEPNANLLHAFLYNFSFRKRLDWQLGIVGYFRDVGVELNSHSYQHLLRGANIAHPHPFRWHMIGLMLRQAKGMTMSPDTRILARKAVRMFEQAGRTPASPASHVWELLLDKLKWKTPQGPPNLTDTDSDPDLRAALIWVGRKKFKPGTAPDLPLHEFPVVPLASIPKASWWEPQHTVRQALNKLADV